MIPSQILPPLLVNVLHDDGRESTSLMLPGETFDISPKAVAAKLISQSGKTLSLRAKAKGEPLIHLLNSALHKPDIIEHLTFPATSFHTKLTPAINGIDRNQISLLAWSKQTLLSRNTFELLRNRYHLDQPTYQVRSQKGQPNITHLQIVDQNGTSTIYSWQNNQKFILLPLPTHDNKISVNLIREFSTKISQAYWEFLRHKRIDACDLICHKILKDGIISSDEAQVICHWMQRISNIDENTYEELLDQIILFLEERREDDANNEISYAIAQYLKCAEIKKSTIDTIENFTEISLGGGVLAPLVRELFLLVTANEDAINHNFGHLIGLEQNLERFYSFINSARWGNLYFSYYGESPTLPQKKKN
jgi:hypothetical protein